MPELVSQLYEPYTDSSLCVFSMYLITPETLPPIKTVQRKIGGHFSCKNKFDKKLEK